MAQKVKSPTAVQETWARSLGREDPLGQGEGQPTPVFLPEELHGQRSPAGYSPWGLKELDTTEQLNDNITTCVHNPAELSRRHSQSVLAGWGQAELDLVLLTRKRRYTPLWLR